VRDPREQLQADLAERYVLERELGRGGMATVYLARDLKHDRLVALKVLHPELARTVGPERFKREIRLAARLQHPHILTVLDSGEVAGQFWFAMPYVRGESLRDRLRREDQLPIEVAVDLARQIALALDYAHREGVIHRDLKPENILLSEGQALVADFGVAKALAAGRESQLTETGMAVGTPAYMSPEQASAGQLDGRSDTYALGCVLYEMLAGEPPFTGPTPQAILAKRMLEPVPHVRTLRESVPEPLEQAITRALAKAPADRFATAVEFAQSLRVGTATQALTVAPPAAPQATLTGTQWRAPRRAVALSTAALLVLGVGAVALLWRSRTAPAALDANLLAVAPFDVLDPELQLWREGLVDLLSRNLDGAGPLHTVPATAVVRRWRGRADPSTAADLGRQTGARLTIFGSLVGAGGDSVRLAATLLDAATGRAVAEVERRGLTARMDRLVDSVTVALLNELGRTRPIGAARLTGLGSNSLPALKAFLQGEQLLRRTAWDSAAADYERAIALDSSFALAFRHLALVRGWQHSTLDSLSHVYALRAGALNHGLAPRDSFLLTADSLMAALEGDAPDSLARPLHRRLFTTLDDATRRYPTDAEAWYMLGEARFHHGSETGITEEQMLEAFARAVELDSAFAPAYIHTFELALNLGEHERARRYAVAYLRLNPSEETAGVPRLITKVVDPSVADHDRERLLDTMPAEGVFDAWVAFLRSPDSTEIAVRLARRLVADQFEPDLWYSDSILRQRALAGTLAYRGHYREAYQIAGDRDHGFFPMLFAELALGGAIPPDTADAVFRRWLRRDPFWPVVGLDYAPPWWAARRDTAALKEFFRRANWPAYTVTRPPGARDTRYRLVALRAYLALARQDTADALRRLTTLPDTVSGIFLESLTAARLLAARGKDREALTILDRPFPWPYATPGRVVWALERARLAERLDERGKALKSYQFVIEVWRHADPELQPYVAEARAGLQRLTAEVRR